MSINSSSETYNAFWEKMHSLLLKDWDPVGIYSKYDQWNTEYDEYIPAIINLLDDGCSQSQLADHLTRLCKIRIGASKGSAHDNAIAGLICDAWNAFSAKSTR